MSCKICGNALNSDERFCSICGAENEDAMTPVQTGEIIPNPPSEGEGGFQIDDSEFVWNIYEFPRPRKTDEIDFTWEQSEGELPESEVSEEAQDNEEHGDDDVPAASASSETENSEAPSPAEEVPSQEEPAPIYVNIYRNNGKKEKGKGKDSTYRASELVFELVEEDIGEKEAQEKPVQGAVQEAAKKAVTEMAPPKAEKITAIERLTDEFPPLEEPESKPEKPVARVEKQPEEPLTDEERAKAIDSLYYYEEEDDAGEDYESLEAFLFGHDAFRTLAAKPVRRKAAAPPATPAAPAAEPPSAPPAPQAAPPQEQAPIPPVAVPTQQREQPSAQSAPQAAPPQEQAPIPPAAGPTQQQEQPSAQSAPQAAPPESFASAQPPESGEIAAEVVMVERAEPAWPEGVTFVPEPRPGMQWHTFRSLEDWEAETAEAEKVPEPECAPEPETIPEPVPQPDLPKAYSPSVLTEQQKMAEKQPAEPEEPVQPVRVPVEEENAQEHSLDIEDVKKDIDPTLNSDVFTKDLTQTKPYARSAFHGKLFTNGDPESDPFRKVKREEQAVRQEPAREPQSAAPVKTSLESELFQEIAADAKGRDDEVEKFFTFSKKNEEFQRLLDKEYEKIKKMNADKPLADTAVSHNDTAASPLLNTFEGQPKTLEGFLSKDEPEDEMAEEEERHVKASHLSEMAKAREAFFAGLDEEETVGDEASLHKKIKLFSKGSSEVHVTVEVKGTELTDLTDLADVPKTETDNQSNAAAEEAGLAADFPKARPRHGETDEKIASKQAAWPITEKETRTTEDSSRLVEAEPAKNEPVKTEEVKTEQVKSEPVRSEPAEKAPAPEITQTVVPEPPKKEQPKEEIPKSELRVPKQETPEKMEPSEEPEEILGAKVGAVAAGTDEPSPFDETLDAIWRPQEEEEEKKAGKKASPIGKIVLSIIAIVLVLEIAALGIMVFMPGTPQEAFVTGVQMKIVETAGNVKDTVTGFFSKDDPEPEPDDPDDTADPGQEDDEEAVDISPMADKTLLIQSQFMSNYNSAILELVGDDTLAYDETINYPRSEIHDTEPITNNVLRVNADGETVLCDASVAAAIVAYNSRWIAFANSGDEAIYGVVMDASPAESFLRSYNKAGRVEKIFHSLKLGDIRHDLDSYYAWVQEVIETIENGASVTTTKDYIYRVAVDGDDVMKVVEQIEL